MINEPASLIPKIIEEAESRPDKSTDMNLIYCRLSKFTPDHLDKVSNELFAIVEKLNSKDIISNSKLFSILRNKRYISKKEIYHKYWQKNFEDLSDVNIQAMDIDVTLSTLSHRYCFLQRGMTSRYRNHRFESLLREFILTEVKYGASGCKPNRLAKLATFIIGYAHDPTTDNILLPEYFVRKIEEMGPQFSVNSVIDISSGKRHDTNKEPTSRLLHIWSMLLCGSILAIDFFVIFLYRNRMFSSQWNCTNVSI